jgi:hypothetical protein
LMLYTGFMARLLMRPAVQRVVAYVGVAL